MTVETTAVLQSAIAAERLRQNLAVARQHEAFWQGVARVVWTLLEIRKISPYQVALLLPRSVLNQVRK